MAIRNLNCWDILTEAGVALQASGLWPDYHALPSATVERLSAAADRAGYRAPRNANGSRARCFYKAVCQEADRRRKRLV